MKPFANICMLMLTVFCMHAQAQQYTLTGHVTDSSGNALPYATVAVLPAANAVRADSTGSYRISRLAAGRYTIHATFVGYVQRRVDTLTAGGRETTLRCNIVLHPAATSLQGVTVLARKQLVTAESGKIVYNVQNAANGAGQTALDVLSKIPGVSIDAEGNISYGGATGVNVMVNGRMTWLSGPQLANYLKGLSAEDIGRVEMITAPDAAFDAAGNAGIIHIVSRKKTAPGLAVDLRSAVSAGHYVMTNQNVSVNYNTDRLTLYGSFDYNTPHRLLRRGGGNSVPGTAGGAQLQRNTTSAYRILYYTWRAGAGWKLHPRHSIALHYHGYLDDFTCFHDTRVGISTAEGGPLSATTSMNRIIEPYHYDAANFSYRFDIDSAGKKITVDADYTSYRNYSDALMTMRRFSGQGEFSGENRLASYQPGFVKIRSIKADAELPFGLLTWRGGLKFAEVRNDNNYRFDSLVNGHAETIANMSNHFKYEERIAAAYASATRVFGRTQVSLGLRVEHTQARGRTVSGNLSARWDYTQLFPSLAVEQKIGDRDVWSFTVNRRINRPAYSDLNPVRWYRDEYFYYAGNPGLIPELAWNAATVYSLKRKYIFTLAYRHSNHYLSERLAFDEHSAAIKSQKGNFGALQRVELSAAIPFAVLKGWEVQWNANASYTTYPVAMVAGEGKVSQWTGAFSLQQEFALPAGLKASLNGYFTTAELKGIFRARPVGYVDAGVKRAFMQNRLNVHLSLNDVFNTYRLKGHSLTDFTDFRYDDKPDSRRAGVSISWHFGGKAPKTTGRKTEEQERL